MNLLCIKKNSSRKNKMYIIEFLIFYMIYDEKLSKQFIEQF